MGNDEYHIDVKTGRVITRPLEFAETIVRRPSEAKFLGAFDFDEDRRWTFIPAATRPERQVGWSR